MTIPNQIQNNFKKKMNSTKINVRNMKMKKTRKKIKKLNILESGDSILHFEILIPINYS